MPEPETLPVLLFASLRDRAGASSIDVGFSGGTVGELRTAIEEQFPQLGDALATSRVAIDHEFRSDEDDIPRGAEVAVIPPVSGG